MMKKFELSFAIIENTKWLVAELLPPKEPDLNWDLNSSLNFQYHYDILPSGIICRFIVRRYENLSSKPTFWHSGVILQLECCKALVRSDSDKGRMLISVLGPLNCRRSALAVIRDEFHRIHATVPKLEPKEMVPLPDDPTVCVGYQYLLDLEKDGTDEFRPEGAKKKYRVTELLDGIEDPFTRKRKGQKFPFGEREMRDEIFISYSHTNENWLKKFKTMLAPLIQEEKLKLWDDTRIKPGELWREEIQQALNRAKIGLLLITPDFLKSDYITKNELPPLLSAAQKEGVTIFWVPVLSSMYEQTPIADYQAAWDPSNPLGKLRGNNVNEALVQICKQLKEAYDT
jgi:GTPase SAR1 family protein